MLTPRILYKSYKFVIVIIITKQQKKPNQNQTKITKETLSHQKFTKVA